jgi:hypothetical protein
MVDLLDNFLNLLKPFLAVASNFTNRYDGEWEQVRKKDKGQTGYSQSGEE